MTAISADENHLIDSAQSWMRLAISVLVGTIGSVGMWAIVVVLPAAQIDFGVDRAGAALPYTATMIGFALGNVLIGRHVDRFGVTLPIILAALSLGGGFALASLTQAMWQFALLHLLIGFGASAGFGPLMADISHWFVKRRGIAVASVACGNYLAGAIWPTIIQSFMADVGWRTTFVGVGLVVIVTLVPLALLLRKPAPRVADPSHVPPAPTGPKRVPLSPAALQALLVIAGLGCCVAMSMPQVHIVAYCVDLGYGPARGAEMLSMMLAAGIISRLASGFLADLIGGVKTLLLGSVLQGLSLFLYLPFDGLVSLYVVSLVFGLSQGGIVPSYAIIVREYMPAREAGQRVGIVIMATIAGMAFGGWLSGFIYDLTGSYEAAFINGIAWNLLNVSVMVYILMRTRAPTPRMAAA
ncbi:MAG: MFS transporter [Rhizobiaceae bacterium]|nr:MFS transporter [Rhizobiaceae bacterium]MCV0408646.1 MFS transporter [Rhizobiaceae bacterium]